MTESMLKREIETITKAYVRAFNSKTLDPAIFYTEDCQIIRPGWKPLRGRDGGTCHALFINYSTSIHQIFWEHYKHTEVYQLLEDETHKMIACEEIGPENATDLAFSRGNFILYTKEDDIVSSGRYMTIWKKIGMTWFIHRDIPMIDMKIMEDECQEIIMAEKRITDAFNCSMFEPSLYYTEDFMLMPVGGEVKKGLRDVRAVHENRRSKRLKHSIAVESVKVDKNSSLAFCKGYFILHSGGIVEKSGRYLSIWKKIDGTWFMHRSIPNIDQTRIAKGLQYDHKEIRHTANKLMDAYNCEKLEAQNFYTTDAIVVPPSGSDIIGLNELKDELQEGARPMLAFPHEYIANSKDNLAYEKGHFIYHSHEGEIVSAGEYVNIWKKVKGKWFIYRDVTHKYYSMNIQEPDVFDDVRGATDKFEEACNSGDVDVAEFYSDDCITISIPGHKPLIGRECVKEVYKHIHKTGHFLVTAVEEIGPSTATSLSYAKGHYMDCHREGDVSRTGRLGCIMKKVAGKWLVCRNLSQTQ